MVGLTLSRRHLMAGGLSIGGLSMAGLTACSPASDGKAIDLKDLTLRVGTYRGQINAVFEAARLADTPYKVAYSEFAGGNLIVEAINARAIDLGSMSEIPPIFAAGQPTLMKVVAVQKADVTSQLVLVPKDSPIQSVAQLKGKRIGYVRATTSQYILLRLLREIGASLTDIKPVALSPQDGLAAFERGELDAWIIYGVQGFLARSRGARVLTTGLGRLSGNYVYSALSESLDDPIRLAAIGDYLQRVQKAWKWKDANSEAWADIIAKATGAPKEAFLQTHNERDRAAEILPVDDEAIASEQAVADAFAAAGVIPAKVDVRPLWDKRLNSFL
jgi:sulfonate transport system substrate-binding protein